MGVPPTSASLKIGEQVVDLAGESGLRIKIIGSTDLTHYGPNYGFVEKGSGTAAVQWVREQNDRQVIDAMRAMDPQTVIDQSLAHHNACCGGAAAAALAAGKRMGSRLCTSTIRSRKQRYRHLNDTPRHTIDHRI